MGEMVSGSRDWLIINQTLPSCSTEYTTQVHTIGSLQPREVTPFPVGHGEQGSQRCYPQAQPIVLLERWFSVPNCQLHREVFEDGKGWGHRTEET